MRDLLIAALVGLTVGCGTPEAPAAPEPAPDAPAPPPTVERAWSTPLSELRDAVERLGAAETIEQPDDAIRAADLARVLSVRDPDGGWTDRARGWLTAAAEDRDREGACGAALALARLEARDASNPRAAYLVAFRTSLRFASSDRDCARAAEAMLPTLAPWRPREAELAAIRADPDAPGDPDADPLAAWAADNAAEDAATLESALVYGHDDGGGSAVRLVLSFDSVVAYEHGEAPAAAGRPRRTWLQLATCAPGEGVARSLPVDAGGLSRVLVEPQGGATRVTLELAEDARFTSFVLPDPFRIVLDVEIGAARAEGPVEVIVLDPGHGGDDFGARAFGMRESDLTLDIARRVRTLLLRRLPGVRVINTREEDVLVSLEARAALANAVDADLFLSIHLNAADEPVSRGGVTTFVLDTSNDAQAARLAARENRTSVAEVSSLERLLASLHRADQVEASRALAEHVHDATLAAGRRTLPGLHDRGVRSALFYVLVGARMPAVLLEASFLTMEPEAEALRTTAYRQALAEGIAEGIARWADR